MPTYSEYDFFGKKVIVLIYSSNPSNHEEDAYEAYEAIQRKNWLKDSFSGSRRIYAGDGRDDRFLLHAE